MGGDDCRGPEQARVTVCRSTEERRERRARD